jgi:hypothetical protein
MEQIIKYVLGEIRVIAEAPGIFTIALFAMAGAVWWAMNWRYGGIVANRDTEISSLKTNAMNIKKRWEVRHPIRQRLDWMPWRPPLPHCNRDG